MGPIELRLSLQVIVQCVRVDKRNFAGFLLGCGEVQSGSEDPHLSKPVVPEDPSD
jgi:hypothetical protein